MYKCTECNAQYEECPDFCDCGNDTFEELYDEVDESYDEEEEYYEEPPRRQPPRRPQRRRLSYEEIEEMEREKSEKQKSIITFVIALIICVGLLMAPPHLKKKVAKPQIDPKTNTAVKLPSVDAIWDSTPLYQTKKGGSSLPILNKNFSTISPVLRQYLVNIGKIMNMKWVSHSIEGKAECKIEFTLNKMGGLETKKIISKSYNEDLDNSVSLLLSNITAFDIPPADYKGERIIMAFSVDSAKGTRKVYYP